MRPLRLAILPFLVATSLAAQAPQTSSAAAAPNPFVAPRRTAFFDVAALIDSRERFGLEPLVFGRWTVGLIGTHSRTSSASQVPMIAYGGLTGPAVPTTGLCPVEGCPFPYPGSSSSYNAWSLDLSVRFYPAALSFNDPRRRFMVYVGEFIGYQQRTFQQQYYGPLPMAQPGNTIPCPLMSGTRTVQDSTVPVPPPGCYPPPNPISSRRLLTGWEPGAEIGMRLIPLDPVFIDVGGWFKLVTVDDPMQRVRPGQLDSRLVVAVGIGW
jgi:hypothetical protein